MKQEKFKSNQEAINHFHEVIQKNIQKTVLDNETALIKALQDIIKHQELVGGGLAKVSMTCHIARTALNKVGV